MMRKMLHCWAIVLTLATVCFRLSECQVLTGCSAIKVFNVGVEDSATLDYLESIKPILTPKNSTTILFSFNFTYFPIKPKFATPNDMAALDAEIQSRKLDAMVSDYYLSVAVVTYSNSMPYFLSGENEYTSSEYQNNMFQYQIDHNQLNATLFDLSAALKRQGYTIFTDGSISSSHFAANVAGKVFTQSQINENTTDDDIFNTLISNKELLASHSWVLLYRPENLKQVDRILNQSGPAGILTENEVFIIPSLEEKQQYLANVRKSTAVIYTFMLPNAQRYNQTMMDRLFVKDCFTHFVAAISMCQRINSVNFTLISGLLNVTIQGESGFFAYRRGIRTGVSINVVVTDRTQPESNFLVKTGTWTQETVPPYKVDYFKTHSIKNSLVRFAAVMDKPYLYRNRNGEMTGISYDLIQLMSASLGFQYELVFVPDEAYGNMTSAGNWTGMMKYLVENKADMSANLMSGTTDRLAYVDVSINMMQSGVQMLIKRSIHQLDFFNVFYPFSWYVWISIVFSMIVLSATLFVSDKISPNTSGKSMFTFAESFFLVLSSFLMSKVETEPRKPSARLFTLLLWFSTLFYMTTYVSNLVPFLVKPDESVPFATISDLQNDTGYKVLFVNATVSYTTVQRRWPELVKKAKKNWPTEMVQDSIENAAKVVLTKDRYVLIEDATLINYQKSKDCSLKTYGPLEEVLYESMLMSRSFPYKTEVRAYLNSIRYSAYLNLEQKYFGLNRCPTSVINPADKIPLGFSYFAGLFAAVGVGAVLGFLYIILHWLYRKISLWVVRRRGKTRLTYGDTYASEILKVTKEGVWVKIDGREEVFFIANNSLHSDPTRVKNAKSLNIRVGQKMPVQYFGKDSATGNRIFARLFENSEWFQAEKNRVVDEDSD